jgi:hypothetical protein
MIIVNVKTPYCETFVYNFILVENIVTLQPVFVLHHST